MSERKMTGAELIAAERQRQIEAEGWDAQHDAEHDDWELLAAAVIYAVDCFPDERSWALNAGELHFNSDPITWPWDQKWDKRKQHDVRRKLTIAGALIAAELDRLGGGPSRG